ncbi:DUF3493 domain containing protein [Nitzschia inconspicua]|uniref:DUF3493 domain containing protein n=1 Tax=Nitzschia inconspicua TaxID=303405 RepID=A0A9K3PZI3_9STRA|nr:DUF3493 domain containing protein [Nitzschia inconspicua]
MTTKKVLGTAIFLIVSTFCTDAFVSPPSSDNRPPSLHRPRDTTFAVTSTKLWSDNKKKGGLEEGMRNKLVTESIAPWRTIRLFLYGALGSGAFVGGLINLSGAVAASNSPDFNLQTELTNIGIDFGAVAVMAFAAKFDLDKQAELQEKVDEKIERKKQMKQLTKGMKEREKLLGTLPLEITVSSEGEVQQAKVSDLQLGAKQHVIIVAGPRKACKDALIGANLLKMDFALKNVLVVPYETDSNLAERQSRPTGGFGDRPSYETQPFIAKPSSDEWDEFIRQEMSDAVKQSGDKAKKEGIAIVVANNGKIIRRGIGTVPWRQMVEQLEETVNPDAKKDGVLPWI